jgi:hypothetical protein
MSSIEYLELVSTTIKVKLNGFFFKNSAYFCVRTSKGTVSTRPLDQKEKEKEASIIKAHHANVPSKNKYLTLHELLFVDLATV